MAGSANQGDVNDLQSKASEQDEAHHNQKQDWRVKLSLAAGATYLYNNTENPNILAPLKATNGVIFPYTPTIAVSYAATYDAASITHSNYKIFQYSGSSIDTVNVTGTFTCQDTFEAQYLLATIHFFRSMTKMFYGNDNDPRNGTPPPLCYISGMGTYQFCQHPLAITAFNYTLPDDVDYIRTTLSAAAGFNPIRPPTKQCEITGIGPRDRLLRLNTGGITAGGYRPSAAFTSASNSAEVTWVPTKIQLSIACVPIMSRNRISNDFSLREYASGKLLGGGMW